MVSGAVSAASEDMTINDVNNSVDLGVPISNDVGNPINGTFTDLQNDVNDAIEGSKVLDLNKNYVYNESIDSTLSNGVKINNSLTINGNGYTIDGSGLARIFNIESGATVNINNVTFINAYADNGGAIFNNGNLTVSQSNFINNIATVSGGAIYSLGLVTVTDSKFTNNRANGGKTFGGAIYIAGEGSKIDNCDFDSNAAGTSWVDNEDTYGGGSLYITANNCIVSNSRFTNSKNYISRNGAGILVNATNVKVLNCNFTDLCAGLFAGGVLANNNSFGFEINNCQFKNITGSNGGALVVKADSIIDNCTFDNCAGDIGNAILAGKAYHGSEIANFTVVINDCTFVNCHSDGDGDNIGNGAIDIQSQPITAVISGNTKFENCTVTDRTGWGTGGGAIYSSSLNLTIKGTLNIKDCGANYAESGENAYGGAIANYGNINIEADVFISNCSAEYGGVIYNAYYGDNYPGVIKITGSLTVSNCSAMYGGVIYNDEDGTVIIYNSKFINNTCNHTGGVIYNAGKLAVNNSYFYNNKLNIYTGYDADEFMGSGAAIYNIGDLTVDNCTFEKNYVSTKDSYNGGAAIGSNGTLTVLNSKFLNNTAEWMGGSIFIIAGTANIDNCNFTGSEAYQGCSIWACDCDFTIKNSNFKNNGPTLEGWTTNAFSAGIFFNSVKNAYIDNCVFDNGTSVGGSAIVNFVGNVEIVNSVFTNNQALKEDVRGYGGAVANIAQGGLNSTTVIKNCTFINNYAIKYGGAIYNQGGDLTVMDSKFINCTSPMGGAIMSYYYGIANVTGCTFTNCSNVINNNVYCIFNLENSVITGSTDYCIKNVNIMTMDNVSIIDNTVSNVIICTADSKLTINNCDISSNVATEHIIKAIDSVVVIDNTTFVDNYANKGIVINATNTTAGAELNITNCYFINNGIYNVSSKLNINANSNAIDLTNGEVKGVIVSTVNAYIGGNDFEDNANKVIFYNDEGIGDFSGEANTVSNGSYIYNDNGTLVGVESVLVDKIVAIENNESGNVSTKLTLRGKLVTENGGVLVYSPNIESATVECQNQTTSYNLDLTDAEEGEKYFAFYIVDDADFESIDGKTTYLDNLSIGDFKQSKGNVILTNAPNGSLAQLVEVIDAYYKMPATERGQLLLSNNYTYNPESDSEITTIYLNEALSICCGLPDGITINFTGSNIKALFTVNDSMNISNINFVSDGERNDIFFNNSDAKLDIKDCTSTTSLPIYIEAGQADGLEVIVLDGGIVYSSTILGLDLNATSTLAGLKAYVADLRFVIDNIQIITKPTFDGVYHISSPSVSFGIHVISADFNNNSVVVTPGYLVYLGSEHIFVNDTYSCYHDDPVNVTVGLSYIVPNTNVLLYVEGLENPLSVPSSEFTKIGDKYYYTFTVETLSLPNVRSVDVVATLNDDEGVLITSMPSNITLLTHQPIVNDVYVAGNYPDVVNITFNVTYGISGDEIVLSLVDGSNKTAIVTGEGLIKTAVFTNVELSKAGHFETVAKYNRNNVTLLNKTVTWDINKLDTIVTFNCTNITGKVKEDLTAIVTVRDINGNLVKSGKIIDSDKGIVYNLNNGQAVVSLKYNQEGIYNPVFTYTDDNYNPSNASVTVTVNKLGTTIKLDKIKYIGNINKTIVIKGTVTDDLYHKGVTGTVYITVNGKEYTTTTDNNGNFRLAIKSNVTFKEVCTVSFIVSNSSVWNNPESVNITIEVINSTNNNTNKNGTGIPMKHTGIPIVALLLVLFTIPLGLRRKD